ncbi:MAG: LysR substrate-binding domain-containing protein [Curvibacter sp.]|jgi:DNA-binding transcriptional LysR family regulator|nr:LysR family transcriptional regulator [Curvibacter sp.]
MRRKIPSLQALACFDAAARHESYTRAAQELALSQSAVSRQIAALEGFLGLALFRRTRHGVALTPEGADYARQIAPRLQALERDTLDAMSRQGTAGIITLATVPTFATRWLLPRLPALSREHPELVIHLETRTRPFLFADTGFDAAIYSGTADQVANWAGTQATRLIEEIIVPVCAPALLRGRRQLQPRELARLPLLQQSTRPEAWRQWFEATGVEAPAALSGPRYELYSMTAAAAAQGLGLALVPRLLIEPELARGELVQACGRALPSGRSYWLVLPDRSTPRPALDALVGWLQRESAG